VTWLLNEQHGGAELDQLSRANSDALTRGERSTIHARAIGGPELYQDQAIARQDSGVFA